MILPLTMMLPTGQKAKALAEMATAAEEEKTRLQTQISLLEGAVESIGCDAVSGKQLSQDVAAQQKARAEADAEVEGILASLEDQKLLARSTITAMKVGKPRNMS